MYKTCMYYSIVHTRLIHASDVCVHVYARWVGFQMKGNGLTSSALTFPSVTLLVVSSIPLLCLLLPAIGILQPGPFWATTLTLE